MAGVGFELKKLFHNRGFFYNLQAYFVSSIITVGPTVLCILLITAASSILKSFGETYRNRQLFTATLTYSFAFSIIITGGFAMLASRYVADCLFEKKYGKVLPSLFGIISIILIINFFSCSIFFMNSKIENHIKLISYIIYAVISIILIQSVYLSCVKEYTVIVRAYFIGGVISILLTFILKKFLGLSPMLSLLFSLMCGFLFMCILFFIILYRIFGQEYSISLSNSFEFLKSMDKYPELIWTGFLFFLGLYGHNFVFWLSSEAIVIEDTYRFYPQYDLAAFYAFLTIMPSMVMFVVKVETAFYEKYRNYYSLVLGNGSIKDVKEAKYEMNSVLSAELRYIIEMQFFISFTLIVIGMRVLPLMGMTMMAIDIFSILTLGSLAYVIMYMVSLILLYFDDRKGTLWVSIIFSISTIAFSAISIILGSGFYGYGFFFSALLGMVTSLFRLSSYIKDIDYYTFGFQPIFIKEKLGVFSKIYYCLVKLEGRISEEE